MSRPKSPMNWPVAVSHVLGDRDPQREQAFDTDADVVFKALQALIATGRCLATASHGSYLPLTGVRRAAQSRMGFNGKAHRDDKHLAAMAIALEGPQGSWIANAARLTYLPPRRGAPAEKAVFHLLLGERHGSPFINDAEVPEPQLHLAKGAWVLLTEADLDVPSLLRGDVDPADLDSLGEAVRGRPRASYVPMDERVRKETALAAVKDAYLAHRGPTPRALQQDDIDVIVRTGLEHGLLINLDLVHAATDNRGSPNSVYPKLADAMRRLAPGRTTADDVDPALVTLWDQLRAAAVATADEQLAPARAALEADRVSLRVEQETLLAERERDARAAGERQQQYERLIQELEQARERIESLTHVERGQAQDIARLSAEKDALRGQLAEATSAHATLKRDHEALRAAQEKQQDALRQEQARAAAERGTAAATLTEAHGQLAHANDQIHAREQALQDAARTIQQLRAQLADSQAVAAEARHAVASADIALGKLRESAGQERLEQTAVAAALQARIDALLSEANTQSRDFAALSATHQAVLKERDRLDRHLARLRPAKGT